MDYEQRYNDALARAKEQLDGANVFDNDNKQIAHDIRTTVYNIFPELAESEDERIVDEIRQFLKLHNAWNKEWFDWLEKQCKQKLYVNNNAKEMFIKALERVEEQNSKGYKLTDCDKNSWWEDFKTYTSEQNLANSAKTCKAESIFVVGKWVVANEKKYTFLVKRGAPRYQVEDTEGDIYSFYLLPNGEEEYHLWTIEDAKDGDVLVFEGYYNSIVLFQGIGINGKGRINYHCKCDLGNYSFGIQGDVACLGTIEKDAEHYHPATKEQRDLLFTKMKEAGYEWNADKKELIKL